MKEGINYEISNSNNETLYAEYFELLISRLTHSSMSLELDLGNVDDSKNAIRLRDNMKTFKYLLNYLYSNETITEEIIIKTANIINASSMYISDNYRKMGGFITETNIAITKPENITKEISQLLFNYEFKWKI